jgi:hypothetical protein
VLVQVLDFAERSGVWPRRIKFEYIHSHEGDEVDRVTVMLARSGIFLLLQYQRCHMHCHIPPPSQGVTSDAAKQPGTVGVLGAPDQPSSCSVHLGKLDRGSVMATAQSVRWGGKMATPKLGIRWDRGL